MAHDPPDSVAFAIPGQVPPVSSALTMLGHPDAVGLQVHSVPSACSHVTVLPSHVIVNSLLPSAPSQVTVHSLTPSVPSHVTVHSVEPSCPSQVTTYSELPSAPEHVTTHSISPSLPSHATESPPTEAEHYAQ